MDGPNPALGADPKTWIIPAMNLRVILDEFLSGAAISIAVALCGCSSGFSYIAENYSATALPETVSTSADTWWIFDKPNEGKILVQRNPASAAGQGFAGGLLLNPTVSAAPKPYYEEAAQIYLAKSGRTCTIRDGYLIIEPSWEFRYDCTQPTITTSSIPQPSRGMTDVQPPSQIAPAKPNRPQSISVPSDSKAQYWVVETATANNGNAIITTKRSGPSGISYSKRECSCPASQFRYLGDGETLADANTPKQPPEELVPLVSNGSGLGSVSYHVCVAACRSGS